MICSTVPGSVISFGVRAGILSVNSVEGHEDSVPVERKEGEGEPAQLSGRQRSVAESPIHLQPRVRPSLRRRVRLFGYTPLLGSG